MTCLSVAIDEDGSLDLTLMLLSWSYPSLDEKLEGTTSNIQSMVEEGKTYLERWRVSFETLFPGVKHDVPRTSDLVLAHANNATPTADNFNQEIKARELLDARIGDFCKNTKHTGNITLHFIFKTLISCYYESSNTDDSSNAGVWIKVLCNHLLLNS